MDRFYVLCFVIAICGLTVTHAFRHNPCPHETTCGGCINVDPTCAWCPHLNHHGPRCVQSDYLVPPSKHACNSSWVFPYPEVYLKDLDLEDALNMLDRRRAKFIVRPGIAVMIQVNVKVQSKHRLSGRVYSRLRIPAGLEAFTTSYCYGFNTNTRKAWCRVPATDKHVGFNVTITANRCLLKTARLRFVSSLSPRTIAKINMNSPCQCECEKTPIQRSETCNYQGDEVCGTCHCAEGSYGERCECFGVDKGDRTCRGHDNPKAICSNRGQCRCGVCECEEIPGQRGILYNGQICQCSNYDCPVWKSQLCGGQERGMCRCGKCQCNGRYSGSACEREPEPCISYNGHVCSNRGRCLDGTCYCSLPFIGDYCDQLSINQSTVCSRLKDCVLVVLGSGQMNSYEFGQKCDRHQYNLVPHIYEASHAPNVCGFLDPADDLAFVFTFQLLTDQPPKYFVNVRLTKG